VAGIFGQKKKPTSKFSGGVFSQDDLNNMFKGGAVFGKDAPSTTGTSFLGSWSDNGLLKIAKSKEDKDKDKLKVSFTGEVDPGDLADEVLSEWTEIKVYELCEHNSQPESSTDNGWKPMEGHGKKSDGKEEGKDEVVANSSVSPFAHPGVESGTSDLQDGNSGEGRSIKEKDALKKSPDKAQKKEVQKKSKWVERGEGCLKVTKSSESTRYRIICRRSQTFQVLVNEPITDLTEFTRSGSFIRCAFPTSSGNVKFFLLKPHKTKLPPMLNTLIRTKRSLTPKSGQNDTSVVDSKNPLKPVA